MTTLTRYNIDDTELRRLSAAFLDRHPEPVARFLAVVAGPGDPLAAIGRAVERRVLTESHGPEADALAAEYAPYEQHSRFIVVLDRDRRAAAGAVRVVDGPDNRALAGVPAALGRTAEQIRAAHGLADGGRIAEFGSLAVLPGYRGKRSALIVRTLLYRALIVSGKAAGVRHVVSVLDRDAYRNTALVGIPLVPLAGSRPFASRATGTTYALYGEFDRFEGAIAEQAARLRRSARPGGPQLRHVDQRTLAQRRVGADLARRLATGDGLDDRILCCG